MQNLLQFIVNHWLLVGLFVILLIVIFVEEARSKGLAGGLGVTTQKLIHLMNREDAVILDLRSANAFKDGHIVNAINIPDAAVTEHLNKINKYKSQHLIVVDGNGNKAMKIVSLLRKEGFEKVQMLTGGFAAWQAAKLPTVKK